MELREPICVLLLSGDPASAHLVKAAIASASMRLDLRLAASREEFLERLSGGWPDILLLEQNALSDLTVNEALDRARHVSYAVPAIVFGSEAVARGLEGAAKYIAFCEMDRLPLLIEQLSRTREKSLDEGKSALDRAADILRENQKLISMGKLAASIAHEINNPLESVTNLLFLLRSEDRLSETAQNYLEQAERELARVVQISKQTLQFHRETLGPVKVEPVELLEEMLVLYARKLEEKQIRVVRQYRSSASLTAFPGEMRQVVSNLLINAIEACSPHSKVVLRVSHGRKWSDPKMVGLRIVVADNGAGISIDARRRIGQLFFTTKGKGGTGLGLWVTRTIIERYGGTMQLYSSTRKERHGTVFSVFMPTNLRPQVVSTKTDGETDGSSGGFRLPKRQRANGTDGKLREGTTSGPAETVAQNFRSLPGGLRRIARR